DADTDADTDTGAVAAHTGSAAAHRFTVERDRAGERIDTVIASVVPSLSRAAVQRLIDDGCVRLKEAVVGKPGQRVRAGDTVAVTVPAPASIDVAPEDIPLVVLYEDADLIVIDKPAGLVVHPAAGHASGTLVNALLFHCT